MNDFKLKPCMNCTKGDQAPRINGIRVLNRGVCREEIVLEFELNLKSNLNFQVQGAYAVSFGVRNIDTCFRARLTASPLFREYPAVGAITVQLIQMPRFQIETTGCLAILQYSPLCYLVKQLLFAWFGRPQLIRLNVAQYLPARARRLIEPSILIKIDVLEAFNLPFRTTKNKLHMLMNPFLCMNQLLMSTFGLQVELTLADQKRRTRINNTKPHAEWNQNFMFISEQMNDETTVNHQFNLNSNVLINSVLHVRVLQVLHNERNVHSVKGQSRLIGTCKLPIDQFNPIDSFLNGREFEAPLMLTDKHRKDMSKSMRKDEKVTKNKQKLQQNKQRQMNLSANNAMHHLTGNVDTTNVINACTQSGDSTGNCRIVLRISCLPLTDNRYALQAQGANNLLRAHWPLAILTVLVDSASGLETVTRHVRAPELRPLVRVSVGNQQMVTNVQERTGQPVWEQTLQFYLYNPKLEEMIIEVVDMYYVLDKGFIGQFVFDTLHNSQQDTLRMSHDGIVVGFLSMPIVDLLSAPHMKREGSFPLEGHLENASIRLQMAIKTLDCVDQVLNNASQPRITLPEQFLIVSD